MSALALAALLALPAHAGRPQAPERRTELALPGGRVLKVDVVDTPKTREIGLMYRKSLPKDYGMLFVFPAEMPLMFWMKNTWVSLDIVFIGADKRITRVHERVPASPRGLPDDKVARVGGTAQFVLELPAGAAARYGLKAGQALGFKTPIPPL